MTFLSACGEGMAVLSDSRIETPSITPAPPIIALAGLSLSGGAVTNQAILDLTVLGVVGTPTDYCLKVNSVDSSDCIWQPWPMPASVTHGVTSGALRYSAWIRNAENIQSEMVLSNQVLIDITAPGAPTGAMTNPTSPSSSLVTLVQGTVDSDVATVRLYSDSSCLMPIGYGDREQFVTSGLFIVVPSNSSTTIYSRATDLAGNISTCDLLTSYVHSISGGATLSVGFVSILPVSPSPNPSPAVVGWTSSDIVTVSLFSDSSCSSAIGSGARTAFTGTGIIVSAAANATTTVYAEGEDTFGSKTPCTFLSTYKHDDTLPLWPGPLSVPSVMSSLSAAPAFSYAQNATDATGVARYEYALGTGSSGASASDLRSWTTVTSGAVASVTGLSLSDGSTYYVNMRVVDLAGNRSLVASAAWVVDVTGPATAPSILATSPVSPSRLTMAPIVTGTATVDTATVRLYSDSACAVALSTGSRADFVGSGITVILTANMTSSIYARGYDAAGNPSPCSTPGFSYTHDSQPPVVGSLSVLNANPTNTNQYQLNFGSVTGSATEWCLLENDTDLSSCVWTAFPLPSVRTVGAAQNIKILSLWVRDAAGNISARVDSNPVRLDTINPVWAAPSLTYSALSSSTVSSPSVSYSRSATDSSVLTYYYAVGTGTSGSLLNDIADWTAVTMTPFTATGLSLVDGTDYYVNMKVVDAAGNEVVAVGPAPFHLDVQIPVPIFNASVPSSPSRVSTTPSIRGTSDGVVDTVTLYSDSSCLNALGSATRANFQVSGISITVPSNSSTGIYIKAFNAGATKASVCSYFTTFLHDDMGPVSPLTVDDGSLFGSSTITPTILWTGGGPDGGSGFREFQVAFGTTHGGMELSQLIPGNASGWLSAGSVYSFSKAGLVGLPQVPGVTNGSGSLVNGVTYYASVRAVDNLGNPSLVAYGDGWTVDTSSPSLTLTAPAEGEYALTSSREIEGACENGSIMSVSYGSGITGASAPLCHEGRYSFIASLTGNAGSRNVVVSRTFAGNLSSVNRTFHYSPALTTSGAGLNGIVYALAPVMDGTDDVFIGGAFTFYGDVSIVRMLRMQQDGSLRTSFSTGAGFSDIVLSILPIADGKSYVGGRFATYDGETVNRIVRLNADGTTDSSFVMGTGFNNDVWEIVAVPGSTDILVGGTFTTYNGTTVNRIVRLREDGSINNTDFVSGTGFSTGTVYALAYDSGGYLHVGGQFTAYNGTTGLNNLVRLQNNGTVANIYGAGVIGGTPVVYDLLLDGTNIHIGGTFTTYQAVASRAYYIVASSSTGALQYTSGCNNTVFAFAKRKTNFVVGGSFTACGGQATANRIVTVSYPSSGTVMTATDPDFAISSGSTVQGVNNPVRAILVPSSLKNPYDKIWIGGQFTTFQTAETPYLARVNGMDGEETLDIALNVASGFNNTVEAIEQMPDDSGRLYIGGQFTTYQGVTVNRIVRVNANGSIDSTFNSGTGFNGLVYTIKADPATGDIYVGGAFTSYNGTANVNRLARLKPNGALDTTFITPLATTGMTTASSAVTRILLTDNALFAAGSFTVVNGVSNARIVKLLKTGAFDTSFNNGSGFNGTTWALAQPDDGSGDLYVGGSFGSYNGTTRSGIVRLNPDGTVDSGFVVGSGVTAGTGSTRTIYDIEISKAVPGTLYITGGMDAYRGMTAVGLARLKDTGAIDTNFYLNSLTGAYTSGGNTYYRGAGFTAKERPDGVIVVGGAFTQLNGQNTTAGLAAFYPDGSVAYTVKMNSSGVRAIANAADGSGDVLVGGSFTDCNALTRNRMMRVSSQGWSY